MITFSTAKLAKNTTSDTLDFSSTNIQANKEIDLHFSDPSPVTVKPDSGYLGMAEITINHPPVEEVTDVTITKNGTQRITPSEGYDATQAVDVTTDVKTYAYWIIGTNNIAQEVKIIQEIRLIAGNSLKAAKTIADSYTDIYNSDNNTSLLIYVGLNDVELTEDGYIKSRSESDRTARFAKLEINSSTDFVQATPKLATYSDPAGTSYTVYVINGNYSTGSIPNQIPVGVSIFPTQEAKTLTITANGTYDVYPTSTEDSNRFLRFVRITAEVPQQSTIDLSTGVKFQGSTWTEIPFDFSGQPTNCSRMFSSNSKLIGVPDIDTSEATSVEGMFSGCYALTEVPAFDLSNATSVANMFSSCQSVADIQLDNTGKVTSFESAFSDCIKLRKLSKIDATSATSFNQTFWRCYLTSVGGFTGLKANINLITSTLDKESILNIFNEAADVTADPKTMTLGSNNLSKVTDEEKAIATNKGWTLA